jgi:hypothetical protein
MSDERNNVIPLSRPFKADPSVRLTYESIPPGDPVEGLSIHQLLDAIAAYGFESGGGPLEHCVEWEELRRRFDEPKK